MGGSLRTPLTGSTLESVDERSLDPFPASIHRRFRSYCDRSDHTSSQVSFIPLFGRLFMYIYYQSHSLPFSHSFFISLPLFYTSQVKDTRTYTLVILPSTLSWPYVQTKQNILRSENLSCLPAVDRCFESEHELCATRCFLVLVVNRSTPTWCTRLNWVIVY